MVRFITVIDNWKVMALFKKKYKRYSTVVEPIVDKSPEISDEVRQTTCYMYGACRCGINVHVKMKKFDILEGNRDHPINKGVLQKGFCRIMQHYSPCQTCSPMKG